MSRNVSIIFLCVILFSLDLILGCSRLETDKSSAQKKSEEDSLSVQIVTIKEVVFRKEEIIESFLYAKKDAFITSKISGTLMEIYVDIGDKVTKGDTLAKIEDELLCLESNLANNTLNQIKQDFDRSHVLYEKKLISDTEYEQMKLKYKQAEIEQQLALEILKCSRLIAPFTGVVVSNWARVGQLVRYEDSLFHIMEMYPVYTRVFLNEEQLTRLKTEGIIKIEPKYGIRKSAFGKIINKSPLLNPTTGTVELLIRVDNKYTFLKPGMTVNVFLRNKTPSLILVVPKTVFPSSEDFYSNDTTSIYLYQNGKIITRYVQLGEDLDSMWEIKGEFKPGDSVLVLDSGPIEDIQKINHGYNVISSDKK